MVRKILKRNVEQTRMLKRMPDDLIALFKDFEEEKPPEAHPLQPRSEA